MLRQSEPGLMRERLIAARAISSVSSSHTGIWESLPVQTDPTATTSVCLRQWADAHGIESGRLEQALAAAEEFTQQVQSNATVKHVCTARPELTYTNAGNQCA